MLKSEIQTLLGSENRNPQIAINHTQRLDPPSRVYKVLIADLIGLALGTDGHIDCSQTQAHIEAAGCFFHRGDQQDINDLDPGVHFFYQPDLSREAELLEVSAEGQYDALIAAATFIPKAARFDLGGVRIGAGTGNMGSESWGGGNGDKAIAALMNTPSFNSRATAQMAMKALLKVCPDLPVDDLHQLVVQGKFDTGKMLKDFPTQKLEGKTMAIIGYGNIGRELAKLAKAFGMNVSIYARARHQRWIESEGFKYAASVEAAASNADVISPHIGLGAFDPQSGRFANQDIIGAKVLETMNHGAIVINYDRGEVVDTQALSDALDSGQIRYAGIDADLFVDPDNAKLSGPMLPYLAVEKRHPGKLELLPHAAADTEHLSRVEGACQAVDQLLNIIRFKVVYNLKGALPEGYQNGGAQTVAGIGAVSRERLVNAADNQQLVSELAAHAQTIAQYWQAMHEATPEQQARIAEHFGDRLLDAINNHQRLVESHGLVGPFGG